LRDTSLDAAQGEYVDALATSGEALLAVISDVLDFSKIEAGRLELDRTDFELRCLVEESCQMLAEQAHGKGLEISHWVDADVPWVVNGDRARLRQVLLNLLSNAVKFTAQGIVMVRVQRRARDVLHFSVLDTGVGIDEAQASLLFEAFTQGDQSPTREYGGTGLGLAISSKLVALMGGELGAKARDGRGSVFAFTAPLPQPAATPGHALPRPRLQGLRVLIVDDNATNRKILKHYLGSWRFACESVDRPSAALHALSRAAEHGRPFDLALLDFNLPEMNGMELAGEIRYSPVHAALKIVILSSSPLERKPFEGAEVSAILSKPTPQSALYDAIAEAVAGGRAIAPTEDDGALQQRLAALHGPTVLIAEDNDI